MPGVERRGRYVVRIDVVTGIHIHLEIRWLLFVVLRLR